VTINVTSRSGYLRHTWPIRVLHWINAIAFFVLLMSGLQIFNAHPTLNWGKSSYNGAPPFLDIGNDQDAQGNARGITRIAGHAFTTTGVLGASKGENGQLETRAFPAWMTIPGPQWLSIARAWHFFFAWVLVLNGLSYVVYGIRSRHLRNDVVPHAGESRQIVPSLKNHLLFRHPTGEAAKRYNILQKLTYVIVIFGLFPLMIVMGWAMSPWLDSILPGWIDVLGGRQSARTWHFIFAFLLTAFVAVHVFEVIVSGLWNNLRSMITGRYVVPEEKKHG
jgi:thiosulfate reductase cytochrome b subunit